MKRRVVITGIGCVSPIGIGIKPFWKSLSDGKSGISIITRFDCSSFDVKLAGEIKEPIPIPKENFFWAKEDVKIGFAIQAAFQAMKDSGITKLENNSLIHLGTSLESFDLTKIFSINKNMKDSFDFSNILSRFLENNARPLQLPLDTACEIIHSMYGQSSIKMTNVSACAASIQAIAQAYHRIADGTFDMALCGGFDSMINPLGVGGFQLLGALSTNVDMMERACRPFDSGRSGTILGEGAAIFILESIESLSIKSQLKGMNKKIYAEIVGYGSSLDAVGLSAPDPDAKGAVNAINAALNDAELKSHDIHAISAHGTGTYLNDEVEASAIRTVFNKTWKNIPVISTKALIGHLIGAAGAVELIAAIQGFSENQLHPNPCLKNIAKGCELDHIMNTPRQFNGKYILKNSFGFGGQNACLIIKRPENINV